MILGVSFLTLKISSAVFIQCFLLANGSLSIRYFRKWCHYSQKRKKKYAIRWYSPRCIFLPLSLMSSPTAWLYIPLLGHRGTHPAAYPHMKAAFMLPPHLSIPNPPMGCLVVYMQIGRAPEHRRHQRTCHHSICITVNTRDWESTRELTPTIRPISCAMSHLIPPAVTPHIPGKEMALGVGTRLCTRLRLARVG